MMKTNDKIQMHLNAFFMDGSCGRLDFFSTNDGEAVKPDVAIQHGFTISPEDFEELKRLIDIGMRYQGEKAELEDELQQVEYWINNKPFEHRKNWTSELEETLQKKLKLKEELKRELGRSIINTEIF